MRMTLNIDDEALEAAMKLSDGRTKAEVVNEALRRFAATSVSHVAHRRAAGGPAGWQPARLLRLLVRCLSFSTSF